MAAATESATGDSSQVFDEQSLGTRLRSVRHELGLSLQEVAARSKLSIGVISQIERGQTSPTFRSLRLLSGALEMPIESFFNQPPVPEPTDGGVVVRPQNRRTLRLDRKGIVTEYIDPDTAGAMQMMLMTIEPGGGTGRENDQHVGEEGGLLLAGQFELWLDEKRLLLNEGDSFRFPASTPHRFRNPGTIPTRIVWFITPTLYGREALERTL